MGYEGSRRKSCSNHRRQQRHRAATAKLLQQAGAKLLHGRLLERDACVRLEKAGRGCFRLLVKVEEWQSPKGLLVRPALGKERCRKRAPSRHSSASRFAGCQRRPDSADSLSMSDLAPRPDLPSKKASLKEAPNVVANCVHTL
jgi:hypothetical protein